MDLPHSATARLVEMRHFAADFFFVVVGDGIAFIHAAEALRGARREKHGGNEGGFAGVGVADNCHISDVCAFVDLHEKTPVLAPFRCSRLH